MRGRVTWVAIGALISVLLAGCSLLPSGADASPSAPRGLRELTWAPPPCGDRTHLCVTLYLENTGAHQIPELNYQTDYRIYLPRDGPLVGGLTIEGGRRVEIIGGEIDLTYPCSDDASKCTGFYVAKNSPGTVFVEGVWIHNPARIGRTCPTGASSLAQTCSTGHGIDINTANDGKIHVNTITLENIRVDGISGCSGYYDHADVLQPYQAPDDTIRIDGLTGVTNCTGLELDPDLAYSTWHTFPASITIQHTNIDISANPYNPMGYGPTWWLTYGYSCQSGPISLNDDYSSQPSSPHSPPSIYPNVAYHSCGAQYSHAVVSWKDARINGVIHTGKPPGGDFVPLGVAGLGYLSPGYQQ